MSERKIYMIVRKYIKDFEEIESYVKDTVSEGDLFFTIGAGNVFKIGENIIK